MRLKLLFHFIIALAPLWVWGHQMRDDMEGRRAVDALIASLERGEVVRVEILEMPPRILTRTRITPAMLEKQFHYMVTIRDLRDSLLRSKILEAAKSISVEPRADMPDLRWGVVFYDEKNARINALYFDKTGKSGAVGNTAVSFKGNFLKWLEGGFSSCLP